MLITLAQDECNKLIEKWLDEVWTIEFVGNKKFLGRCHSSRKLEFSKHWFAVLPEEECLDTIKHEIAHAICYEQGFLDAQHNKYWKSIAVQVGAKPIECYNGEIKRPVRYKALCTCGFEYTTGSLSSRYIFCSKCKARLIYVDQYSNTKMG